MAKIAKFMMIVAYFTWCGLLILLSMIDLSKGTIPYIAGPVAVVMAWFAVKVIFDKATPEERAATRTRMQAVLDQKKTPKISKNEKLAFHRVDASEPRDQDLDEWSTFGRALRVRNPVSVVIKYMDQQGKPSIRRVDLE